MILDSSAIVAILLREEGCERIARAIGGGPPAAIGAPSLTETGLVVVGRKGIIAGSKISRLLEGFAITVVPFTENHGRLAIDAFFRFGRGNHPAALNYGDCMTYATAAMAKQPLLCLGEDFAQTDLELVAL